MQSFTNKLINGIKYLVLSCGTDQDWTRRTGGILGRYAVTMSSALQRVVWRLKAAFCDIVHSVNLLPFQLDIYIKETCISACLLLLRSYSSVITVTRPQARKCRIGFRFPAVSEMYSCQHGVQTSSRVHPAFLLRTSDCLRSVRAAAPWN